VVWPIAVEQSNPKAAIETMTILLIVGNGNLPPDNWPKEPNMLRPAFRESIKPVWNKIRSA
jgi:hypothetical protein